MICFRVGFLSLSPTTFEREGLCLYILPTQFTIIMMLNFFGYVITNTAYCFFKYGIQWDYEIFNRYQQFIGFCSFHG